jgi:hypothetical protein
MALLLGVVVVVAVAVPRFAYSLNRATQRAVAVVAEVLGLMVVVLVLAEEPT